MKNLYHGNSNCKEVGAGPRAFNGGEIVENKPIGFNREGGALKSYSNLFYWAYAEAKTDSTIGLHPHEGFEIMSFVLRGQIKHYDTKGKNWIPLNDGDVQIIRAGNGISHAEFMAKDAVMFQIWFDPGLQQSMAKPATYDDYAQNSFPETVANNQKIRTLVGEGSPLRMDAHGVTIQGIFSEAGDHHMDLDPNYIHSFYLIKGEMTVDGQQVMANDFIK